MTCPLGWFVLSYINKRCHGNDNANVMLDSLSFDTYCMYLLSATEKKTTGPKLEMLW